MTNTETKEGASAPNFLDLTPTWEETERILIRLLEAGDAKGRAYARSEIERMGKVIDALMIETGRKPKGGA